VGLLGRKGAKRALPHPGAARTLAAEERLGRARGLDEIADQILVSLGEVKRGLALTHIDGRMQVMPGRPPIILDVAHNPHAARSLASGLGDMGFAENTLAVFAMLADKDIAGVVEAMRGRVDRCSSRRPRPIARRARRMSRESSRKRAPARSRGPSPRWLPPSTQHVGKRVRMIELSSSDRSIPWRKRCGPRANRHGDTSLHRRERHRRRGRQRLIGAP
jgi:hypothetical protein